MFSSGLIKTDDDDDDDDDDKINKQPLRQNERVIYLHWLFM